MSGNFRRLIRMLRTSKAQKIRDNLDGTMTIRKLGFGRYDVTSFDNGRRYSLGQVSRQLINGRIWWRARLPDGISRAFDDLHRLRRDAVRALVENDREENR